MQPLELEQQPKGGEPKRTVFANLKRWWTWTWGQIACFVLCLFVVGLLIGLAATGNLTGSSSSSLGVTRQPYRQPYSEDEQSNFGDV